MRNAKGQFQKGPDPDRHEFTLGERRRGWKTLVAGGKKGQLSGRQQRNAQRRVSWFYKSRPEFTQGSLFDVEDNGDQPAEDRPSGD